MSIFYCNRCKLAFLKDQALQSEHGRYCRKCKDLLVPMGTEHARVSLAAHMQSKESQPIETDTSSVKPSQTYQHTIDKIILECQSKLDENPLDTTALFTLCKWYYSKGLTEESLAIANQIISLNPEHKDTLTFLSTLHSIGKPKETDLPDDVNTLQAMAQQHINKGTIDSAENIFKKLLTIDSNYAPAHRYLSEIYTKKEDYKRAIEHLNHLTLIYPKDCRVYYNLAVTCYYANDVSRALSNLREAQLLCVKDPEFMKTITNMIEHIEDS